MKGKTALADWVATPFFFVIGAVISLTLAMVLSNALYPETAEASTQNGFDDLVMKLGLKEFEEGQPVIAYGYVDNGAMIIGFNSGQMVFGEVNRPKQCGARSNSCICACRGDSCEVVLDCKGFPSGMVSGIVKDGGSLKIDGGKQFVLRLRLVGNTLGIEDVVTGPAQEQ